MTDTLNDNSKMEMNEVEKTLRIFKVPQDEVETKVQIRQVSDDIVEKKVVVDIKDILDMPTDEFAASIGLTTEELGVLFNQWIEENPKEALELLDFLHET